MDTNQFVLSVAAFMVLVTLILTVSQWEYRPAPQSLQRITCTFDKMCRGGDCSAQLPADIVILPKAEDGRAYFHEVGDAFGRIALETVTAQEWVMRRGDTGMMRLHLHDTGALIVTETAGFSADSAVLSTATGFCVDADHMSKGQA